MKTHLTKHKPGEWKFNDDVAQNFDLIAEKNIPHYKAVISKCVQIAEKAFSGKKDIKIIDVGSATGQTLDAFVQKGFTNVWGVDSSESMIKTSLHNKNVILSEKFPTDHKYFDLVIANWTLHFVHARKEYLEDIYNSISDGGYLILTDKMTTSKLVHDGYHDFKRSQGVSDDEIQRKAAAIEGILVTKPLAWYIENLYSIGFSEVEVIDADWCFATLLCKK